MTRSVLGLVIVCNLLACSGEHNGGNASTTPPSIATDVTEGSSSATDQSAVSPADTTVIPTADLHDEATGTSDGATPPTPRPEASSRVRTDYTIHVVASYEYSTCNRLADMPRPGEPRSLRICGILSDGDKIEEKQCLDVNIRVPEPHGVPLTVSWPHKQPAVKWSRIYAERADGKAVCAAPCLPPCERQLGVPERDLNTVDARERAGRPSVVAVRCCFKPET